MARQVFIRRSGTPDFTSLFLSPTKTYFTYEKMDSYWGFIESKGGNIKNIYAAMDNDDLAQLVRATTTELKKARWQPHNTYFPKSIEASAQYRIEGNDHYNAGRKRQAVELYNKAIAFAPFHSVELELALGNRSAVFYSIKYYTGCIEDIAFVTEVVTRRNNSLPDKLKKRLELAMQSKSHEATIDFITNVPFTMNFLDFSCKKNTDVPCVSAQVSFSNDKRIKAKSSITPGSLVGLEKAYVACTVEGQYLSCYYCNRLDLRLIPCLNCTVLFCDRNCMNLCYKEYHRVECHIMNFISKAQKLEEYQLMRKTAIKLSLKLGWDAFVKESRNMGLSRMKKSTAKETFNSGIATSILSYDDTDKHLIEGKLFNGSFMCSGILQLLEEIPSYFPKDKIKKAEAWNAMARVMLYLSATYNKIPIKCSAYDFQGGPFRMNVQTNSGWFSMSSKLKHSCTPNLHVVGLNDSIGLVALRTIKKGEELTICYYTHFYENTLTKTIPRNERSIQIFSLNGNFCDCDVCSKNWDSTSAIEIQMNKQQEKLYKKVDVTTRDMSFSSFYDLCNVLDRFPHNCWNHRFAYMHFLDMLKPIQSKYRQNKTYYPDN